MKTEPETIYFSVELQKAQELNAELLAALKKAAASDIKDKCQWIDEAEAAIAKAQGDL